MTTIHKIKWVVLVLIALIFGLFVTENTGVTTIRFLGWEMEAPRMLLISGVGLTGFIAGVLAILLIQRHRQHKKP